MWLQVAAAHCQEPPTPAADQPAQQLTPQPQPDAATENRAAGLTVRGTVIDSVTGEPLPRALVRIEGDADSGALTDGEGRFEMRGVPAGPQTIRVTKPGFHDRPYPSEDAGLQADGPAHSVLLEPEMAPLRFPLTPFCSLRGHIELSTGDPAQGIVVVLLRQVVQFGRRTWVQVTTAKAGGEGAFRFAGLPDGVYAVYTQPALESEPEVSAVAPGRSASVARAGYPATFYPDAREFAGAAHIQLAGGQQGTANFSLSLEPFQTVTATGLLPSADRAARPAPPDKAYSAVVLDPSGHLLPYDAEYDETSHEIQASLPDGSYSLLVRGFREPDSVFDIVPLSLSESRRAGAFVGSIDFTVAGHPVTGLRVPLGTPPTSTIRVHTLLSGASETPVATANTPAAGDSREQMSLLVERADVLPPSDAEGSQPWLMEAGQDTIEFAVANPGLYWLSAYVPQKSLCIASFTAAGANLAREPLALSPVAPVPAMELTLRDDCAQLVLTLPQALATFVPGDEPFYTVYVVPDFDTVQDIAPMTMHPSSGPTLKIDGLTPGSYHVFTFPTPVHLEYRNPAVLGSLANAGQQVTLAPSSTASLVLEAPGS